MWCNVTLLCVDIPILLYVHTVPTYGRETCERKAMNQWISNLEVIHWISNHHRSTITRNLPRNFLEIALPQGWKNVSWTVYHQAHLREEEKAAAVRKREMEAACQDWCAWARLPVGKRFLKAVDDIATKSSEMQWHVDGCSWLQWLWKLFPSDFNWICVTGLFLYNNLDTRLCFACPNLWI